MSPPAPVQPALGVKQTIQARHGVATYVPQGYTIKIINTYGKQVVDTWAFALHAPPEDADIDKGEKKGEVKNKEGESTASEQKIEDAVENSGKTATGNGEDANPEKAENPTSEEPKEKPEEETEDISDEVNDTAQDASAGFKEENVEPQDKAEEKTEDLAPRKADGIKDNAEKTNTAATEGGEKATEKAPDSADESTQKKSRWSAYIPSLQRAKTQSKKKEKPEDSTNEEKTTTTTTTTKSWSEYLGVGGGQKEGSSSNTNSQQKGWSAYIPSGQAFSSYIPSKEALSAFAGSHHRDPTKSYAEQLYDFSKTPVGAASLSAATGSGYAGSLYAAYKAYEQTAGDSDVPAMEYMSMMHTRASTLHLSPRVGDTLVSNLRAPLLTVVEDTSPGSHDTLIAACDPQRYKELGVEKWEEHGSCSENCVLALKEINERSGLKGKRAIGSDVTVNTVPAPLNLFMNIPWTQKGDISFEEPKTKRGDYIKFRAERDVVVVMSACPQDVLAINGHKPMVAHFVVESSSSEDMKEARAKEQESESILAKARRRMSSRDRVPKAKQQGASVEAAPAEPPKPKEPPNVQSPVNHPRPGRKAPRKLEKRSSASQSPAPAAKA
ncbi:uncharacterized protein PV09_01681 [Verruconis gallopava]|uniref:DUF1989 domain-containing protein n=1 Tax=Verruconis gallopava TaxID=253628 RepID=A0A0D1Z447_9PEZI|nr:uncharacterized protein PV09_01681 [Verruconis gallopava]KIW07752.1 hypothetical protein PV09_01681 [Verruconis gallopava]